MAFNCSFFTAFLLLFSFLVLACASDYSYNTKSYVDNSKSEDNPALGDDGYNPKPYADKSSKSEGYKSKQEDDGYKGSKPEDSDDKSKEGNDGYASKSYDNDKPKSEDNDYNKKPDSNYKPKPEDYNTKPDSDKPKSEDKSKQDDDGYGPKPKASKAKPEDHGYNPNRAVYKSKPEEKEKPLPIRLELVLCKSNSNNYYPISGAVAKITCRVVDEHGQETTPWSLYSTATDAKGYFMADLSQSILTNGLMKLIECKAYLNNSPIYSCKIPTDVNKGISGALLSSYRILEEEKIKLYWVGPFFFTSEVKSNPGSH